MNGDTLDTKAVIRAEIANRLIELLESTPVEVIINTGNHDLLNSESKESSLNFLRPYATVVSSPTTTQGLNIIPYQNNTENFLTALNKFPKGSVVIGHQGTLGGNMGEYVQDKSAFDYKLASNYKVFLSHYHSFYELGTTVSIGSPYTINFAEAKDPEKGFLVVYDDGSYDRVLTNLRRHHVIEMTCAEIKGYAQACAMEHPLYYVKPEDLLWLKITGSKSELSTISKKQLGVIIGKEDFKLDLLPTENETTTPVSKNLTNAETLDKLIDELSDTVDEKQRLKTMWRQILET
jgi:DNA repair exonuclease SbcCD nuclease subunit